jgi:hypothetical protein
MDEVPTASHHKRNRELSELRRREGLTCNGRDVNRTWSSERSTRYLFYDLEEIYEQDPEETLCTAQSTYR